MTGSERPFLQLRNALWQLSLEPNEQRQHLARMTVTDELALDLDDAVSSLAYASESAGTFLPEEVTREAERLNALTSVPPEDPLWHDDALDRHATWADARVTARRLLPLLSEHA